jgi:hypothetical protein
MSTNRKNANTWRIPLIEQRELFSTSKVQDEIKTEKFELNKFHASKKDPFY